MELPEAISEKEQLYRVVKRSKPEFLLENGSVSPALFKDMSGVSVDRDGGRTQTDVIRYITEVTFQNRAKAVALVSAGFCFEIAAAVEPSPSPQNPYHANIWLDRQNEQNRNLQALKLADYAKIVYYNDMIRWT